VWFPDRPEHLGSEPVPSSSNRLPAQKNYSEPAGAIQHSVTEKPRLRWTVRTLTASFRVSALPVAVYGDETNGAMRRPLRFVGVAFGAALLPGAAALAEPPASPPTTQPVTSAPTSAPAPATAPAGNERGLFAFDELTFELGFEAQADRRENRSRVAGARGGYAKQTDRAWRLEETFGARGAGSVIDDRVLQFDWDLRWGLSQEHFHETWTGRDRDSRAHGDLFEYDVNLTFLPRGKLSATAQASRESSRLPRAFLPSLDRTRERYTAGLFYNDEKLPMRLTFEHEWDELTSRTHDLSDDEQRGRHAVRYEGTWQISELHALTLEYEHEDRRERYSGTDTRFDTTRDDVLLRHVLRFGPEGRSSVETLARFQDESGDLARDLAEFSSRLRLQCTDALATNFAAQYLRETFQDLETSTWRGEAGLTHQFDNWLTTSAQLYALQTSADENADWDEWGGMLGTALTRDNDLGRFSANLSYNHASTETRNGRRSGVVIGESVTFRDPLPVYLAHTDVNLGSLVVTDANRTRTYLAGRDYLVVPLGRYTALRRMPTGQIADRQGVLVSYTYRVQNNYDVARDRIDFRMQQAFDCGLTPYYAASVQNEDLDRGEHLGFRARNVNRHRLGATFRQPRWSAGLEYEYNDDAIDPFQAVHANGDVVIWQAADRQLDGRSTLSRFWFDGSEGLEARNTTLLDCGLSYRQLLSRQLELTASGMYRFEDDTLYGRTHGVDFNAAVEWHIGYFSLRFEAEYDLLDLPGSRDNSAAFWLKLKRDIPVLARKER
jgi:hypothetical protein